ncbi:MAG: hypothetical protein CVU06_15295, partial [Bacteroidetes bacterium HGW-Bacteroidetes-22]
MESIEGDTGVFADVSVGRDEIIRKLEKQIEQYKSREARLFRLIDEIPTGIAISSNDENGVVFNKALFDFLDLENRDEQLFNKLDIIHKLSHPDDLNNELELIENQLALSPEILKYSILKRYKTPAGNKKTGMLHVAKIMDNAPSSVSGMAIVNDFTEWKRSEKALQNIKDMFTSMFASSADALVITNLSGMIEDASGS